MDFSSFEKKCVRAATFALLSVVVWFMFRELSHLPGMNGDELWGIEQARRLFSGSPFSWLTPSRRPIPITYCLLAGLCDWILPDSYFAVRLPAVLSGLLTLVTAALLLPRILPSLAAWTALVLLACFPASIAYSRIGWEISQVSLAGLLTLTFSYQYRWVAAMGVFVFSVAVIHPTLVLLFPIIVAPWVCEKRPALFRKSLFAFVGIFALGCVVVPSTVPHFLRYLARFVGMLSGSVSIEGFAGPLPAFTSVAHFLVSALILCLPWGTVLLARTGNKKALGFVVALYVAVIGFFVVSNGRGLDFGRDRYGVFLLVPSAIALGLCVQAIADFYRRQRLAYLVVVSLCSILLIHFYLAYFQVLQATGGNGHFTYRSAATDPKWAAAEWIVEDSTTRGSRSIAVSADGWFMFYSLRYAIEAIAPKAEVSLVSGESVGAELAKGAYVAVFADSPLHRELTERFQGLDFVRKHFLDYGHNAVLTVWRKKH
jgi:hypothetical protein